MKGMPGLRRKEIKPKENPFQADSRASSGRISGRETGLEVVLGVAAYNISRL
jgi:hypothetical protein